MKYQLRVDQRSFVENKIDIDLVEACILDVVLFATNHNNTQRFQDEVTGKWYFWISHQWIINQLPLAGLNKKDSVYRRMVKLCKLGLLASHKNNKQLNRTYYCIETKLLNLLSSDCNPSTSGQTSYGTYGQPSLAPTDNHPEYKGKKEKGLKEEKGKKGVPIRAASRPGKPPAKLTAFDAFENYPAFYNSIADKFRRSGFSSTGGYYSNELKIITQIEAAFTKLLRKKERRINHELYINDWLVRANQMEELGLERPLIESDVDLRRERHIENAITVYKGYV